VRFDQESLRQRAVAVVGPVWEHRPFRRQIQTQVLHAAGDAMVAIALANTIFFAVPLGEARSQVALYLALTMAPFAVVSPLIGPWLDRHAGAYRVAIVGSMVCRVVFAILLSSRFDQLYLYPLAFGLLVMSRIHGVSRTALVPATLPPGRPLMWANSWVALASVVGGALGAGPAVGMNALFGTDQTLWAAAVVFAAGALTATGLPSGAGGGARRKVRPRDLIGGLSHRVVAGAVAMATLRGTVGFVIFLFAFLLKEDGAQAIAIMATAAAGGTMVGSVVAPLLRRVLTEPLILLGTLLVIVVASLWALGGFGVLPATVLALIVGFSSQLGRLAFDSLLQKDAPDWIRGRAFARYETLFQFCWVVAAGLAAAIPFAPAGGLWTLIVICLGGIGLSVWTLRQGVIRATAPSGSVAGAAATSPGKNPSGSERHPAGAAARDGDTPAGEPPEETTAEQPTSTGNHDRPRSRRPRPARPPATRPTEKLPQVPRAHPGDPDD
jgi:hypothetical protein